MMNRYACAVDTEVPRRDFGKCVAIEGEDSNPGFKISSVQSDSLASENKEIKRYTIL
jgi:hypothetical protein